VRQVANVPLLRAPATLQGRLLPHRYNPVTFDGKPVQTLEAEVRCSQ